jgi:hypothetical protein
MSEPSSVTEIMSKETEAIVDRAVSKVNSMTREDRDEFEKSILDPLRKLYEDAYVQMKQKGTMA